MNFGDTDLPDRFWDKISPCPMTGCWLWFGSTTNRGYGSFNLGSRDGRQVTGMAHKITFTTFTNAPLPVFDGVRTVLDHKCRVRACCNPRHLEAVPEPVNVARGLSPSALHAQKTHCPKGHAYVGENVITYRKKRYCRACRKLRGKS